MKLLLPLLFSVAALAQPNPDAFYKLGPDSLPQDGVPKGEIRGPFKIDSKAYPGTFHTYWVYVPAQYDAAVPASLMIFNDGQAFMNHNGDARAQNVMDNLIYRRELPVMIGVFINPGHTPEQPEPTPAEWGDRTTNRPTEYNTLDDKYARVIVDELMPELYKGYNISKDPDRHGIGGASSGAIAAFTVAWERPNEFRKVLSIVGSFVNLRGGHAYADIVRKADKKPIRIFLQDGENDLSNLTDTKGFKPEWTALANEHGNWHLANLQMLSALEFANANADRKKIEGPRYDINHVWGDGAHSDTHGGALLPDILRWMFRDFPKE